MVKCDVFEILYLESLHTLTCSRLAVRFSFLMSKNTYNVNVLFQQILICPIQLKLVLFSGTEVMLFKWGGKAALIFSWSLDAFEYNNIK